MLLMEKRIIKDFLRAILADANFQQFTLSQNERENFLRTAYNFTSYFKRLFFFFALYFLLLYKALFSIFFFCESFSNCGTSLIKILFLLLILRKHFFLYYEIENPFFQYITKVHRKKDLYFLFLQKKREIKLKKFRARRKLLSFIIFSSSYNIF